MKSIVCAATLLAALSSTSVAAQQDLARRSGLLNCHSAEQTSRRMPAMSMPEQARRYGVLGEDKLVAKLLDGSGGHPPIRSNADDARQFIRWMLTLKQGRKPDSRRAHAYVPVVDGLWELRGG